MSAIAQIVLHAKAHYRGRVLCAIKSNMRIMLRIANFRLVRGGSDDLRVRINQFMERKNIAAEAARPNGCEKPYLKTDRIKNACPKKP